MATDYAAFVERLERQKWVQGSRLTAADLQTMTVTMPAASAPPGATLTGEVVLISQDCDLYASFTTEPLAVAVPILHWDQTRSLPSLNSSRYFVLDRDARLVAWHGVLIQFRKAELPDREATLGVAMEQSGFFAAWSARRWRRTPLPEEFTQTVGEALATAIGKFGRSEGALSATSCWRVEFHEEAIGQCRLLALYDDTLISADAFGSYTKEIWNCLPNLVTKARRKLEKKLGRSVTAWMPDGIEPISLEDFTIADALRAPMITYDHLSFGSDDADGDLLPRPGLELREEDIL